MTRPRQADRTGKKITEYIQHTKEVGGWVAFKLMFRDCRLLVEEDETSGCQLEKQSSPCSFLIAFVFFFFCFVFPLV